MPETDVKKVDVTRVRPYGDAMDDGAVQLSFTLPVPHSPEAAEAARAVARAMGLKDVEVVHDEDLGGYSFFVVYGRTTATVDMTAIVVDRADAPTLSREEAGAAIAATFGRPLVFVGACIGSDAHTVGIDAIMNMKGFDGNYGLERFENVVTHNLGAQVAPEDLLKVAIERRADVILVSQVVTEKGFHKQNLTRMVELVEAAGWREKVLLICGGPRLDHKLALELGYDAGFGRGTYAAHVVSFAIEKMRERGMK